MIIKHHTITTHLQQKRWNFPPRPLLLISLFLLQKYGYLPRLNSIYHNINVITKSPLHGHYAWIASQCGNRIITLFFKVHRISGIIHTEDQMISCLNTELLTIKACAFALLYITTITSLPPLIITHQQYFKTVQTHTYSSLLQTHDRYYNQPILKVQ